MSNNQHERRHEKRKLPALLKLHKRDWSSLNLETQNKASETETSQFIQPNL